MDLGVLYVQTNFTYCRIQTWSTPALEKHVYGFQMSNDFLPALGRQLIIDLLEIQGLVLKTHLKTNRSTNQERCVYWLPDVGTMDI